MLYTRCVHHRPTIVRTTSIRLCPQRQRTALLPILDGCKSPIKVVLSSRHRLVVV